MSSSLVRAQLRDFQSVVLRIDPPPGPSRVFFHYSPRPLGSLLTQEKRLKLSVSVLSHLCDRDKNS